MGKNPKKESTSKAIKLSKELEEAIKKFLKTEQAKTLGYRYKLDVANQAVREWLIKQGFFNLEKERFKHFNVYEDHVTLFDNQLMKLVEVQFKDKAPFVFCTACETSNCEHIDFALNLAKVKKILETKGLTKDRGIK